ncbi:MAG: hypothetical protein ACE5GQ_10315 [Nitrospinales bacterium]
MKRLVKNKILAALVISIFGLFMANSALAMTDMADCPMKIQCVACAVSISEDFSDMTIVLPTLCNIPIAFYKLEVFPPDPFFHPPRR